jgi:hypothetical protein
MKLKSVCAAIASCAVAAFSIAAAAGDATPGPATPAEGQATPIRAVIELFTSQGCSSCPPADTLLKSYSDDPSIVALSMPVDYWDYLGWKDTYASSRNSDRQRAYAKARGDGAIYTPQAVINGMVHVNGSQKNDIDNAVEMTSKDVSIQRVPVKFWQERNTLNIATGPAQPGREVREATVWLGVVQTSAMVDIKTGENAGKSLVYTNVVRDLTPIGLWKGEPLMIQIPRGAVMLADTQKSVVLIQEGRAGPIIGAAWAGLW